MTPPNKDHFQDHAAVARSIEDLGYEVEVTDEFPADLCGYYQGSKAPDPHRETEERAMEAI